MIKKKSRSVQKEQGFKCKDLLDSDLVGIWKDRTDIIDTVKFVEDIRKRRNYERARNEKF